VLQVLSAYGADFTAATTVGDNAAHFATTANQLLSLRFLGQRGAVRHMLITLFLSNYDLGHAVVVGVDTFLGSYR